MSDRAPPGYTLMVAGQRSGKTAFLRLLLDTSDIAPSASKDQLASVAKFVQGASSPTALIRTASVDVSLDPSLDHHQPVTLNLVDTPTLDAKDKASSERVLGDIIHFVESRFADSLDRDYSARLGDHHVHLCIYFLDPDAIVPPSAPTPPVPLLPRGRNGSVSQSADMEPLVLEPPVATSPLMTRPMLPAAEVRAIHRLSSRCNVLPVIARADTLTTERLAAIKVAVRRDLAEAGIGFGIFDLDGANGAEANGSAAAAAAASATSSPQSPSSPSFLRLPYALISPDCYAHSDGVGRPAPSRHELVHQYSPPPSPCRPPSRLVLGKFIRTYRWGFCDVLDHTHCDFLPLRRAIFHHMETLQKYTCEYLFDKFRQECLVTQPRPPSDGGRAPRSYSPPPPSQAQSAHPHPPGPPPSLPLPLLQQHQQQQPVQPSSAHAQAPASLPLTSRPILTIDAPPVYANGAPRSAVHHQISAGDPSPPGHPPSPGEPAQTSASKSSRQRSKKITIACNFCRSRKLKCDGQRPACHQCQKRSHQCDYQAPAKRRGGVRARRPSGGATGAGNGALSDSDGASGDDGSPDPPVPVSEPVSHSPHTRQPLAPLSAHDVSPASAASMNHPMLPPLGKAEAAAMDRREGAPRPFLASFPPSTEHAGLPAPNPSGPPLLPPFRGNASGGGGNGGSNGSGEMDSGAPTPGVARGAPPPPPTQPGVAPQAPTRKRAAALAATSAMNATMATGTHAGATAGPTTTTTTSSSSARGGRVTSSYGPKVVACNHCRARKTKCDGLHPTCSSCARRSLQCDYVNDPRAPARRRASHATPDGPSGSHSGPPSASARENEAPAEDENSGPGRELKREYVEDGVGVGLADGPGAKRMRVSVDGRPSSRGPLSGVEAAARMTQGTRN